METVVGFRGAQSAVGHKDTQAEGWQGKDRLFRWLLDPHWTALEQMPSHGWSFS